MSKEAMMENKDSYFHHISIVVLSIILLLSSYGFGDGQGIAWKDLPEHLAQNNIPVEQFDVVDCPPSVEMLLPDQQIAQVIENTFYLWSEYDVFSGNTKKGFCIVMEKPHPLALSAYEASVLLTASKLWMKTAPLTEDMEVLDSNDPGLNLKVRNTFISEEELSASEKRHSKRSTHKPDTGVSRRALRTETPDNIPSDEYVQESVQGDDDRARIGDSTIFPWNTLCYLSLSFPDGGYRGSGTLVTPYMVLTCGHNIYDTDTSSWVNSVTAYAGQNENTSGTVTRPYGSRTALDFHTSAEYVIGGNTEDDYAAVHISNPFTGISTFMPVQFNVSPSVGSTVTVPGYPGVAQGIYTQGLWWDSDSVYSITSRIIRYMVDTSGGNSGGPVMDSSTGSDRIIGVHTFGSTSYNGGPRLVSANQALVTEWMQWAPTTVPLPPENVSAVAETSGGQVLVTWDASDNTNGYRIFYDEDTDNPPFSPSQNGTPVSGSDVGNVTEVLIEGLTAGQTYYFSLIAYNDNGDSDYSPQQPATVANSDPDMDGSRFVDYIDFAKFAANWMMTNCGFCGAADYDGNSSVDADDLIIFANQWLVADVLINDDFESGDLTALDWQTSGHALWHVVSDIYNQGSYSAKSGDINDSQTSTLEITQDGPAGTISFYRKVSSESNYDYLRFYIDDVELDQWSGNWDWSMFSYPISAGQHTFKWSFTKDFSLSSGSDCGWIDDLIFTAD